MQVCCSCKSTKEDSEFNKNKSTDTGYDKICRSCRKEKYNSKSIDKERRKAYESKRKDNQSRKQYLLEYRKNYKKKKEYRYSRKNDYKSRARNVLYNTLSRKGLSKTGRTEFLLGFSFDQFKEKFDTIPLNFHIDHCIPVSWFLEETPIYIMNSLENLQIISDKKNFSKNNLYSDKVGFSFYREVLPYIKRDLRKKVFYF